MAWLPDTNIWIRILKQPGGKLQQAMLRHPPDHRQWHDGARAGMTLSRGLPLA